MERIGNQTRTHWEARPSTAIDNAGPAIHAASSAQLRRCSRRRKEKGTAKRLTEKASRSRMNGERHMQPDRTRENAGAGTDISDEKRGRRKQGLIHPSNAQDAGNERRRKK
eukprot:6212425-Pleurochrysis_carterae.AAC.8